MPQGGQLLVALNADFRPKGRRSAKDPARLAFRQRDDTARCRGQVTRWSFTTPTACRYA